MTPARKKFVRNTLLVLGALFVIGHLSPNTDTPAQAQTPIVSAPTQAPDGCWTEPDGEPMFGSLDKMPVGSTLVDCNTVKQQQGPTTVLVPDNEDSSTIAMVAIPQESPDGGYPTGWKDNSPTYSDGWTLLVDDAQHTVKWVAPTHKSRKVA
jgi:hypothetical protein